MGCNWNRTHDPVFIAALLFRMTVLRYFEIKLRGVKLFHWVLKTGFSRRLSKKLIIVNKLKFRLQMEHLFQIPSKRIRNGVQCKLEKTRKCPLHGYILGVLRHITALDQHCGGDEKLKCGF